MQILRCDDYRRVPWRNGGGETAEILVHPKQATFADFGWRVSMAPVVADGAFSLFPGIDRVLTVIEGSGLSLALAGGPPVVVTGDPFAFSGDLPCEARLGAGPIVDLNVMTRRGAWRGEVRNASAAIQVSGAAHHLVFAAWGPVAGNVAGEPFSLMPRDTLWLTADEIDGLELSGRWLDIQLLPLP